MYCRKCGTSNPDDRTSCVQCNALMSAPLPMSQTPAFSNPSAPTAVVPNQQQSNPQSPATAPVSTNPAPYSYQSNYTPQSSVPIGQQSPALGYGVSPQMTPQSGINQLAIVSVVCGGIGLCSFACGILGVILTIPAVVGIVTGFMSLKKIKQTGEKGREVAIAGIVTGGLGIIILLGFIIYYIVIILTAGFRF